MWKGLFTAGEKIMICQARPARHDIIDQIRLKFQVRFLEQTNIDGRQILIEDNLGRTTIFIGIQFLIKEDTEEEK